MILKFVHLDGNGSYTIPRCEDLQNASKKTKQVLGIQSGAKKVRVNPKIGREEENGKRARNRQKGEISKVKYDMRVHHAVILSADRLEQMLFSFVICGMQNREEK